MAGRGGRGAPYAAAVTAEPEPVTQLKDERRAPEPSPVWPSWIRPISDYERKETTIVEGLRYG
jgi:hypothetical protein